MDKKKVCLTTVMVEVWKQFKENELTHSMAHYLFAIHDLIADLGYARVTDVARKLNIARSSASLGLQTLVDKGLVEEDQNKFVKLTDIGNHLAEEIIGKKIVFRRFLQDILQVKPQQAEIDTCKVEHLISSETGEKLLDFLKFMTSNNQLVKDVLKAFWSYQEPCKGVGECSICTDVCLKEKMLIEVSGK